MPSNRSTQYTGRSGSWHASIKLYLSSRPHLTGPRIGGERCFELVLIKSCPIAWRSQPNSMMVITFAIPQNSMTHLEYLASRQQKVLLGKPQFRFKDWSEK
jgi:hypothetical protein